MSTHTSSFPTSTHLIDSHQHLRYRNASSVVIESTNTQHPSCGPAHVVMLNSQYAALGTANEAAWNLSRQQHESTQQRLPVTLSPKISAVTSDSFSIAPSRYILIISLTLLVAIAACCLGYTLSTHATHHLAVRVDDLIKTVDSLTALQSQGRAVETRFDAHEMLKVVYPSHEFRDLDLAAYDRHLYLLITDDGNLKEGLEQMAVHWQTTFNDSKGWCEIQLYTHNDSRRVRRTLVLLSRISQFYVRFPVEVHIRVEYRINSDLWFVVIKAKSLP